MEDFAQVFEGFPEDKYELRSCANIAPVLWTETGQEGTYVFVRRLVLSVLIGNADMHVRKLVTALTRPAQADSTPAYDFVGTLP